MAEDETEAVNDFVPDEAEDSKQWYFISVDFFAIVYLVNGIFDDTLARSCGPVQYRYCGVPVP